MYNEISCALAASNEAIKAGLPEEIVKCLNDVCETILKPPSLRFALGHGFRQLCNECLSSCYASVRRAAASLLLNSLLSLKEERVTQEHSKLIKSLLQSIDQDILSVAIRSDLFKEVYDKLAQWCSAGMVHRKSFLEVVPVEELAKFDIFHFPSECLASYIKLIRSVIEKRETQTSLFSTVTKIFKKTLKCTGNTCGITIDICAALVSALDEFEKENPLKAIIEDRVVDALVRHVVSSSVCNRKCLVPLMTLILKCLTSSSRVCLRLIDQGILNVVSVCFVEYHSGVYALSCRALALVFACRSEHIKFAMLNDLVKPLFLLREDASEETRSEARSALEAFFSRVDPEQLYSMVGEGYVPLMARHLRPKLPDVNLDGLHALFALISATRATHPLELSSLHQELEQQGVTELCNQLKEHEQSDIRYLAIGLHTFMTTTLSAQGGTRSAALGRGS